MRNKETMMFHNRDRHNIPREIQFRNTQIFLFLSVKVTKKQKQKNKLGGQKSAMTEFQLAFPEE